MALSPGTRLGPYEITAQIGAGGMGEVYRARDTHLKRAVAIKVLPDSVASDAERLARFQREAEVLASLNHPNIAAIYGLEKRDGTTALIMELVEGPTLADRIVQGPIPIDEALPIARQIAEALEAAHERGIIHRDLKPANIALAANDQVKVLDFGLAKLAQPVGLTSSDPSASPTITSPAMMTGIGIILGTAAYMSPEQAKGRNADKRSDIWAFGCVLYEMLTGARAFLGADIADTLAAVLRGEPTWTALPPDTPPPIHRLLRRCLEKDRTRRLDSAADARLEIQEAVNPSSDVAEAAGAQPRPLSRRWIIGAATVALLVVAAIALLATWVATRPAPPPTPELVRFTVTPPAGHVLGVDSPDRDVAMSPDGRHLVYQTGPSNESSQLVVRRIDQLEGIPLRGLSGARGPFISPDSRWIGFFVIPTGSSQGELRRVPITGGPPITVCRIEGNQRGASWGADDTITFATSDATGLMSVPVGGGEPTVLSTPDRPQNEDHVFPSLLPHGRAVLFTILSPGATPASTAANAQVAVLDLKTGVKRVLLRGASQAEYVESGHLVYAAGGLLRAVRFDLDRLEVVGDPVTVVEGVQFKGNGVANFGVSRKGTLVHVPGVTSGSGQQTLAWVDRKGNEEPIPVTPGAYVYARLSPDGTRVALDVRDNEQSDIWILELARQTFQRLTTDPGRNRMPVWTPDSTRVAFTAVRDGVESVHWQRVDGSGTMERLSAGTHAEGPQAFSRDGAQLIVQRPLAAPAYDLAVIALGANHPAMMLLHSAANETNAAISPDGRWLAYESNEAGDMQVWVRPFPNVGTERYQVSTAGGVRPLWSPTGRELFYHLAPDTIMAVPVRLGGTFAFEKPQPVVKGGMFVSEFIGRHYDVSADGQRFLILKDAAPPKTQNSVAPEIHVAVNWIEELKRLVPMK